MSSAETIQNKLSLSERLFISASLFLFVFDLNSFSYGATTELQVCWAHFPNCREWLPLLDRLPGSYSHQYLFMVVFSVITMAFIGLLKNWRRSTLILLAVLTIFKLFFHFFWKYSGNQNFEYFHLIPTIAFLLNSKHRILGAQVAWATLYFLAAFVKIDESWVVGSYFSALELGLPVFPDATIPLITQGVILAECFLSWGLLSQKFRRVSFVFWLVFHLYSVLMVGFFYPTRCVLFLVVLFLDGPLAISYRQLINTTNLILLSSLLVIQVGWIGVPENTRSTLRFEGYGFNMFDTNFQCVSSYKMNGQSGTTSVLEEYSHARFRCGPRVFLERYKQYCQEKKLSSLEWKLWQSLNGGPFYEIVNTKNACSLSFSLFRPNPWIELDAPALIGYPRKNALDANRNRRLNVGNSQIVFGQPVDFLSTMQKWIQTHLSVFKTAYFLIWLSLLVYVCRKFLKSR